MGLTPLQVTRHTTFAELKQFSDQVGNNERLLGKHNKDGSITLYVRDSKPGLLSPITEKDRAPAREAVRMVFENTERSMTQFNLTSVKKVIDSATAGELKGIGLKLLLGDAGRWVETDRPDVHGPGLDRLGDMGMILQSAARDIPDLTDGNRGPFIQRLGFQIATRFQTGTSEKIRENLALSNGRQLKEDLRVEFEQRLGASHPMLNSPKFEETLEAVFQEVAGQMLKNRQNTDGTLQIGTDKYVLEKHLGDGAFGTVDLYRCGNKLIAFKTPKNSNSDTLQEVGRELRAHRQAHGTGHSNVLGLVGPVRLQNGQVGVAMEVAPNRTVHQAVAKIAKAVADGTLSKGQANAMRLTLLKDIVQGLQHMSANGIVHRDFRTANIFIGERGLAKIADFGLSIKSSKFVTGGGARNAYARAPEESIEANTRNNVKLQYNTTPEWKATAKAVREAFGNLSDSSVVEMVKSIRKHEVANSFGPSAVSGEKVDEWQLGIMAFQLMFDDRLPFPGDDSTVLTRYAQFGSDFSNRAIDTTMLEDGRVRKNGAFAGSTGFPRIDNLLNQLLHPDPKQRPDMATLLRHDAFRLPGVGEQTTRDMLVALMQDDKVETTIQSIKYDQERQQNLEDARLGRRHQ